MKVEIIAPQRLLNHQQIEAVEILEAVAVGQRVSGVRIAAQQNAGPAGTNFLDVYKRQAPALASKARISSQV